MFCFGGSKAFAVGYACDSLLFIPAGYVMDTYGRKYAGLPAYLMLSMGLAAVPLVASLPGLILVSIVMGLGNGCSAGLNVTLGTGALNLEVFEPSNADVCSMGLTPVPFTPACTQGWLPLPDVWRGVCTNSCNPKPA